MKRIYSSIIVFIFVIAPMMFFILIEESFSHGKEKHHAKAGGNEVTYTGHIKPLFEKKCANCHGAKSPEHMEYVKDMKYYRKKMKGPRMDNYTYLASFIVWPDTGSLMRAIDDGKNTENGKPGRMYKNLGETEKERQNNLKIFKDWIGFWTLKKWAELEKEDINKIKLTY